MKNHNFTLCIAVMACIVGAIITEEITTEPGITKSQTTISSLEDVSISTEDTKIDINNTISEVERLLALDPNLPRLSRSEILELLDNITKSDELKETTTESDTKSREEYQRAIMYVLPYSPTNYSNMQELYTKPPMTHIVGNNNETITTTTTTTTQPTVVTTSRTIPQNHKLTLKPKQKVHVKLNSENGFQIPTTEKVQNITKYNSKVPTIHIPSENVKIPFTPINITETASTTVVLPSKELKTPIIVTTTEYVPKIPKAPYVSRGAMRYPNHRYPEDLDYVKATPFVTKPPESAMKVMTAPNLTKPKLEKPVNKRPVEEIKPPVQPPQHTRKRPYPKDPPTTTTTTTTAPSPKIFKVTPSPIKTSTEFDFVFFKDLAKPPTTTTEKFEFLNFRDDFDELENVDTEQNTNEQPDFGFPDNFQQIINNIDLNTPEGKNKYSSQYTEGQLAQQPPPMRQEVKDILASIGLFPAQPTSTTAKPDWSAGAEGLDPEMRELLMTFGLIPNPNGEEPKKVKFEDDYSEPTKPLISKESYTNFKPLPATAPSRQEMNQLLQKFGLLSDDISPRNQKAINVTKSAEVPDSSEKKLEPLTSIPDFDDEIIPDDMKDVLEDIGIKQPRANASRAIRNQFTPPKIPAGTKKAQHIFNPDQVGTTKEELEKLELLISTIKTLEKLNGTKISQEDLDKLDLGNIKKLNDDMNKSLKDVPLDVQESGDNLDPVRLEELQYFLKNKNEFKRQNNGSSTASADSLADSFPGITDTKAQSTAIADAPLPQPRRNGFYFLLDWNSFLEVGDNEKTKVNINFSPKVGDPSRFIKV